MDTSHYFILYEEGNEEEPMIVKKKSNLCMCLEREGEGCECVWSEMLFLCASLQHQLPT